MIPLRRHRAEHDQFPLVADFVEPEDVHAIVIRSDFDVPIAGSVPLIHDFYDVDEARFECASVDSRDSRTRFGTRSKHSRCSPFRPPCLPQMSQRVLQVSQTTFGDQDDERSSQFMGHTIGAGTYWGSVVGTSTAK